MSRLLTTFSVYAVVVLMVGCSTQRPIGVVRDDADFHYKMNRHSDAVVLYQEIADRRPGDWEGQYKLGLCLLELKRANDARIALEQAHNLKPNNIGITDALAEAMYQTGDYPQLFSFLREQTRATQSTRSYLNLAKYAIEIDDIDAASNALLTAIQVDEGGSVEPYISRAAFAARVGDNEEVIRRLRQAYAINPNDKRVLAMLREYGEVPGPTIALEWGI